MPDYLSHAHAPSYLKRVVLTDLESRSIIAKTHITRPPTPQETAAFAKHVAAIERRNSRKLKAGQLPNGVLPKGVSKFPWVLTDLGKQLLTTKDDMRHITGEIESESDHLDEEQLQAIVRAKQQRLEFMPDAGGLFKIPKTWQDRAKPQLELEGGGMVWRASPSDSRPAHGYGAGRTDRGESHARARTDEDRPHNRAPHLHYRDDEDDFWPQAPPAARLPPTRSTFNDLEGRWAENRARTLAADSLSSYPGGGARPFRAWQPGQGALVWKASEHGARSSSGPAPNDQSAAHTAAPGLPPLARREGARVRPSIQGGFR